MVAEPIDNTPIESMEWPRMSFEPTLSRFKNKKKQLCCQTKDKSKNKNRLRDKRFNTIFNDKACMHWRHSHNNTRHSRDKFNHGKSHSKFRLKNQFKKQINK